LVLANKDFDFLPKISFFFWQKSKIFWQKLSFFRKLLFFCENFDFWGKFRFLEKNFNLWRKFSIFGENYDFWQKFQFLEIISITTKNLYVLQKNKLFCKILKYYTKIAKKQNILRTFSDIFFVKKKTVIFWQKTKTYLLIDTLFAKTNLKFFEDSFFDLIAFFLSKFRF